MTDICVAGTPKILCYHASRPKLAPWGPILRATVRLSRANSQQPVSELVVPKMESFARQICNHSTMVKSHSQVLHSTLPGWMTYKALDQALISLCLVQQRRPRNWQGNGLAIHRSRVRFLAWHHCIAALSKLLTYVCLCHQAV